ncbi:MAG: CHAT domain-containing protein [Pirellulales bacterium]|nr:CHAT domain-containing protein [Pirellulales bacterium]
MSTNLGGGSLTQLAQELRERTAHFSQTMQNVLLEFGTLVSQANLAATGGLPDQASLLGFLDRLADLERQADALQQEEESFLLSRMGPWGKQQVPQSRESWRVNRGQLLECRAQVCRLLECFDDTRQAVDTACSLASDLPVFPPTLRLPETEQSETCQAFADKTTAADFLEALTGNKMTESMRQRLEIMLETQQALAQLGGESWERDQAKEEETFTRWDKYIRTYPDNANLPDESVQPAESSEGDPTQWRADMERRATAALAACDAQRPGLFRRHIQEAIDLADRHGLRDHQINLRITRYQYLLIADGSGQTTDELTKELDARLSAKGVTQAGVRLEGLCLIGVLPERLDQFHREAVEDSGASRRDLDALQACFESGSADVSILAESLSSLKNSATRISERARSYGRGYFPFCLDEQVGALQLETLSLQAIQAVREAIADVVQELDAIHRKMLIRLLELAADMKDRLGDRDTAGELRAQAAGARPSPQAPLAPMAFEKIKSDLDEVCRLLQEGHPADALALLEQIRPAAEAEPMRRQILLWRMLVYTELNRFDAAEADLDEAAGLLAQEIAAQTAEAPHNYLREEENLALMKAFFRAQAGCPVEAWEAAERGRARVLQQQLAAEMDVAGSPFEMKGYEPLREWLQSEQVAMISFGPTRWGTCAMLAGPDDARPETVLLKEITGRLIQSHLGGQGLASDSQQWTRQVFGAVACLSEKLLWPLEERLIKWRDKIKALYVIPDEYLFRAPFAALTFRDGTPLIDAFPLAYTSSSTIALECAARRRATDPSCLAVGVGGDQGVDFRQGVESLESLPWPRTPTVLLDDQATAARFLAEAPRHDVIHLACHGSVSSAAQDFLAASQLQFADNTYVTGRAVQALKLDAELVFLNACQSGRFRLTGRTQVGGFWRAFLLAGARSMIGTLTHVHPDRASELAQAFYRHWLTGATKAESLRLAQQTVRATHPDPAAWAPYCLIGNHR